MGPARPKTHLAVWSSIVYLSDRLHFVLVTFRTNDL